MFKLIFKGFTSNRAGKLYLISIIILIFSNILINTNNNLYIFSTIAVIIYVIALINYSRYLKMKIWVIILLVGLTLVPMGIWLTLFHFARKNYNIQKSKK